MESGALSEFGGLQKKVERGEWLTLTPVWVERPAQKGEGRRKSDRNGFGAMPSGGGGRRNTIFNYRIDPQLRIMGNMGNMQVAAHSENLCIPLEADGREICLRFSSKGDCVKSCTRSHALVRGYNHDLVIHYIMVDREAMNQSHKRKYDGGGD